LELIYAKKLARRKALAAFLRADGAGKAAEGGGKAGTAAHVQVRATRLHVVGPGTAACC
jgi:hypothetical protein